MYIVVNLGNITKVSKILDNTMYGVYTSEGLRQQSHLLVVTEKSVIHSVSEEVKVIMILHKEHFVSKKYCDIQRKLALFVFLV